MKYIFLLVFLVAVAASCSDSRYPGYDQTENGLYFKIVEEGKSDAKKPQYGDFLEVKAQYVTMDGSVKFDSDQDAFPMWIPLVEPTYHGDIMEGLAKLKVGDSASFIVRTDSFYLLTVGAEIPDFAAKDSLLYINIRLLDVKTQSEFAMENELLSKELATQYEQLRLQEEQDLAAYLKKNNITTKPTSSGLIFMPKQVGSGPRLTMGQVVRCHYTSTFLDGQVFGSTTGSDPIEITVGSPKLLEGFNEALLMMSVGSQATVIMPSSLAFGQSSFNSDVPPYATLIFDITVISGN